MLSGGLKKLGVDFVDAATEAETVIISTCAFIGDAQEEAVDAILEGADWKNENDNRQLYVTGCIPARYTDKLKDEIPEVDGWYGPGDFATLLNKMNKKKTDLLIPENSFKPDHIGQIPHSLEDMLAKLRTVDSQAYAYLKVSEGCDRRCAYCAIPDIRGPYSSRRPGSILSETSRLLSQGVKEIILTSEEINSWGRDLQAGNRIETLLPKIGELVAKENGWLRILYTHPPLVDENFIDALVNTPSLVPYLDFPIEHADDTVLRKMGRGTTWEKMKRSINLLREKIDGIALRTSIIVGHPGEGEAEFENLILRLEEAKFERLGVFCYSPEEGTRVEKLDSVSREVAEERSEEVMNLALDHADEWYAEKIGKEVEVLTENVEEDGSISGRSVWDAPDIDGDVIFLDDKPQIGHIIKCKIIESAPFTFSVKSVNSEK